jgi:hypothetical protein
MPGGSLVIVPGPVAVTESFCVASTKVTPRIVLCPIVTPQCGIVPLPHPPLQRTKIQPGSGYASSWITRPLSTR